MVGWTSWHSMRTVRSRASARSCNCCLGRAITVRRAWGRHRNASGGRAGEPFVSKSRRGSRVAWCSSMAKSRARHRSRLVSYRARLRSWSDRRFERPRHAMADTLLLVDDDASVLRAIGEYFERIGYEVWRESTGAQAGDTFQRVRPDVGPVELQLPNSNRLVVLQRLGPGRAPRVVVARQGDRETAGSAM